MKISYYSASLLGYKNTCGALIFLAIWSQSLDSFFGIGRLITVHQDGDYLHSLFLEVRYMEHKINDFVRSISYGPHH